MEITQTRQYTKSKSEKFQVALSSLAPIRLDLTDLLAGEDAQPPAATKPAQQASRGEPAWIELYIQQMGIVSLDAQRIDTTIVTTALTTRQVWQFDLLPLRREGGRLVLATTTRGLRRAVAFAANAFDEQCQVIVADDRSFEKFVRAYHHWPAGERLRNERLTRG